MPGSAKRLEVDVAQKQSGDSWLHRRFCMRSRQALGRFCAFRKWVKRRVEQSSGSQDARDELRRKWIDIGFPITAPEGVGKSSAQLLPLLHCKDETEATSDKMRLSA